ncbi:MAG: trigger factor [Desulfobacterales bacterium]
MKFTVEDVNTVKKILHVEIPKEDVTSEIDEAYKNLKKGAKVKGFRPGKAPRSVLERVYKKDVNGNVSSKLIQDSIIDAIKEAELKIIGNPIVDPPELNGNESYKYDATIEVKPEIEKIDFKGLNLKRTLYKVSDEEVDTQLKMLQKNLAQKKPIEKDRPVQDGDFVVIDYEGFNDGKPFAETQKTNNFINKVGEGPISKDFDSGLIGMKPEENKEIKVNFPEDYFNDKLANLEITFHVKLKEIREEVLPEIDNEFAKNLGKYKTLSSLKKEITNNLKNGYAKRVEQELNEQIFTALIEKTDFEVPEVLVNYELDNIIEETERSFAFYNKSMEEHGITRETISEEYRDTAEKQVRRHLILNKVIQQENMTLSDKDLDAGYEEMSQNFQQSIEEIKKFYNQNKDKLEFFKQTLLEKNAIKLIIDNSLIEDKEPDAKQDIEKSVNK